MTAYSSMYCQLINSIHDISAKDWDRLFTASLHLEGNSQPVLPYPFLRHDFLAALEDSGCTQTETGWTPKHLLVFDDAIQDKNGKPQAIAAMPLYLKHHSYGEYVFDWAWADAYRRNGMDYYPKLLSAVPFTPATGPRLAIDNRLDSQHANHRQQVIHSVSEFLVSYCHEHGLSGWHQLFLPEQQTKSWRAADSLTRTGCQFHWINRNYQNFDEFLQGFNSRKRKSVRKERRQVAEQGVTLSRLVGPEISKDDWDRFYHFYHTTYLKRSGNTGYLNREFFEAISRDLSDQILMVKADIAGQGTVACALCFFDDTHLYGRYWGCQVEVPGLHFEACYYQGIEFAIERGLKRFDPGAQGEHKIQRGFEPTLTYSQHWLADDRFHTAVDNFLTQETPGVEAYQTDCQSYLPFKQRDQS